MSQVKDHVCPNLARRVPVISVLLGALFQEYVSNFTIHMLLLQNTPIIKHYMRIDILESGDLVKSKFLNEKWRR
jgi:hypothetical protein